MQNMEEQGKTAAKQQGQSELPPRRPRTNEELLNDPKFVAFLKNIGCISVEGVDSLELCREVRRG